MSIGLSTPFSFRSVLRSTLQVICCLLMLNSARGQTITIPGSNDNDTSTRKPFGCFYWYERTNALYTSSEMGGAGYITKVAFYLNSVNSPAESTPIVIKMKNAR